LNQAPSAASWNASPLQVSDNRGLADTERSNELLERLATLVSLDKMKHLFSVQPNLVLRSVGPNRMLLSW
jgi:hypothetical protein